ncbi:four helix bundle protein [Tunicatimonas pelagia]|uniref:four helix bundle protein n=1 Tax=Tunicatimonas pelagia TaxID=931531 RepID=UPI002666F032|nr:four helix bundle protein [Tunicatimonas pelagia]WKN46170.1 four helix bundle protein [Tunicatimonas pelagia]
MAKVERFEDLRCWQSARSVVRLVYRLSQKGELRKYYDTQRQFRRAALSIMNNIAEGFARYHPKEFSQFLNVAQSSVAEVKSILYVLEGLSYFPEPELRQIHLSVDDTRKSILALIKYIQNRQNGVSEPSVGYTKQEVPNHHYILSLPKKHL